MTDHDRAERALSRAFADHDEGFQPLDPALLIGHATADAGGEPRPVPGPGAGRGSRRWLGAAAAAVVLVIVVPIGASLLQSARPTGMTAGVPAGAEREAAPGPAAAPGGAAAPVEDAAGAGEGAGTEATRTVTVLDVAVEVPAHWGGGVPVGGDWCAEPPREGPSEPFVQSGWPVPTPAVVCPGPVPDDRQTMHLAWRPAEPGDTDGTLGVGGWRHVSRVVGDTHLTVVVAAGDEAVAARILATARVA